MRSSSKSHPSSLFPPSIRACSFLVWRRTTLGLLLTLLCLAVGWGSGVAAAPTTPGSVPLDGAELVSHTLPTLLECGSQDRAQVTYRNTGASTWTRADSFALGSPGDTDPLRSPTRLLLPRRVTVAPGDSYTFDLDLLAPATAGTVVTDWRMIHQGVRWFGETAAATVTVFCEDLGVQVSAPRTQALLDGGTFDWGVVHQAGLPANFNFSVFGPEPAASIDNLRIVSSEGPLHLENNFIPSGQGLPASGLGLSASLRLDPAIKPGTLAEETPFRIVLAFDHSLGGTFQFEIVGTLHKTSLEENNSWQLSFIDFLPFQAFFDQSPFEQTYRLTAVIDNLNAVQSLRILPRNLNSREVVSPFGVTSEIDDRIFGSAVIPPFGSFEFDLLLRIGPDAESGAFSADVTVSPDNSSQVDVLRVFGDINMLGPPLSLGRVSVRLTTSNLIAGHLETLPIPPVEGATDLDFFIENINEGNIRFRNLQATIFGPAAPGLAYSPSPTSGEVSSFGLEAISGQLQILSQAVPGDFEIRISFDVLDDGSDPPFNETFHFTVAGTLLTCGGGGNCGPVVRINDDRGDFVSGTYRRRFSADFTRDLTFRISNLGDEDLGISLAAGGLSGSPRFSVSQGPSLLVIPPGSNETSEFKIQFDGEGTEPGETFATNVSIANNSATDPYVFRIEVETQEEVPLDVEVVDWVINDRVTDIGEHRNLPLPLVFRITNNTDKSYFLKGFGMHKVSVGPLDWQWTSDPPPPESTADEDAILIRKNGTVYHTGGNIVLDEVSGDPNTRFNYDFAFQLSDHRYRNYSDYDLRITGVLRGIYNPISPVPIVDCEDPDADPCLVTYCAGIEAIFDGATPTSASCISAAGALLACSKCKNNGFCWAACLSGVLVDIYSCIASVDDIVDELRTEVQHARACYCEDNGGPFCQEAFFIGWEVEGLPLGTFTTVTAECRNSAGLFLENTALATDGGPRDHELLRCPPGAAYTVSTSPVGGLLDGPYDCRLMDPAPGDLPGIPQYSRIDLQDSFTARFDCGCPNGEEGCGQYYTLTGTAEGLQPGEEATVVVNIEGDPIGLGFLVDVDANGSFEFERRSPGTSSYTVAIQNKAEVPHCAVETTGNPIGGAGTHVEVVRLRCDRSRPNVRIIDPADGATVSTHPFNGTIAVRAAAGDVTGIAEVLFYADDALFGLAREFPYIAEWTPPGIGFATLHAVARNVNDVTTQSETINITVEGSTPCNTDTSPPIIEWTDPGINEIVTPSVPSTLEIFARVTDDTAISYVDIFFDGQRSTLFDPGPIYGLIQTSVGLGSHTLRVRATDVCGKVSEVPTYSFTVIEEGTDVVDGSVLLADCEVFYGFAEDLDNGVAARVGIYRDGPRGIGTFVTQVTANQGCGGTPDLEVCFSLPTPPVLVTGSEEVVYFHAQDRDAQGQPTGQWPQLAFSPKLLTCGGGGPGGGPSAPLGVTATQGTMTDRVRVNWSTTPTANSYMAYRSTTADVGSAALINNNVLSTTFDDMDAAPGTTYYYWIKSRNSQGTSDYSSSASGYADGGATNTEGPAGYLDGAMCTQIAGWARDPDFAGRIRVALYRGGPVGGGGTFITNVWADQFRGGLPFPDKNHGFAWTPPTDSIPHGTLIYAYGLGVDSQGNANGQNVHLGTSPKAFNCPGDSPPSAPSGLSASDGAFSDRIRITWNASTGATSYSVWKHFFNDPTDAHLVLPSTGGTSFDDLAVDSGRTYYYWVTASNDHGTSGFSAANTGFAQGSSNTTGPEGTLDLAECDRVAGWARDPDWTGAVEVHLYKGGPFGGGGVLFAAGLADIDRPSLPFPDTEHHFDFPVAAGTIPHLTPIYAYALGVDSTGTPNAQNTLLNLSPRAFSCPGSAPPNAPTGVQASDGAFTDRVRVTWNSVSGASSYSVWRFPLLDPLDAVQIRAGLTGTSYDDQTAAPGQLYYYWVKATNSQGSSGLSQFDTGRAQGTTNTAGPDGTLDLVNCTHLVGWARDPDFTGPIQVHFYQGGPSGGGGTILGHTLANIDRPSLPFPDTEHHFSFPVPAGAVANGTPIYAYGIGVDSAGNMNGENRALALSPKTYSCP